MFWIQVLHQISVLQRFFPSLFILITVLCKEVVHFNKIKHQYFSFIDYTSVSISQKSLSNPKSPRFFIVQKFYSSSYTFRSMTHSNFCEGQKVCVQINFLQLCVQMLQYYLFSRLSFFSLSCLCSFVKDQLTIFRASYSGPLMYLSVLLSIPVLIIVALQLVLMLGSVSPPTLFFNLVG